MAPTTWPWTPSRSSTYSVLVQCWHYWFTIRSAFWRYSTWNVIFWMLVDPVDIFDIFGECCHPTSAVYAIPHWWSGNNHCSLLVCHGWISSALLVELGVQTDYFAQEGLDCVGGGTCSDWSLLRLFLYLLYKVRFNTYALCLHFCRVMQGKKFELPV